MPNPPRYQGLVTLGQAMRQCPPLTSFMRLQRKRLLILSLAFQSLSRNIHYQQQIDQHKSTNWTKIHLPALVRRSTFQPESLSAILSTIGWTWALVSLWGDRGTARYLQGKSEIWQGRWFCNITLSSSENWMGWTLLFCTFVLSPDASPKSCKMSRVILMSLADGCKNITTSST